MRPICALAEVKTEYLSPHRKPTLHKDSFYFELLPYFNHSSSFRLQLNPYLTFAEVLSQVTGMEQNKEQHASLGKLATYLENTPPTIQMFSNIQLQFRTATILPASTNITTREIQTAADLSLTVNYDEQTNDIACTLDGSCDLFDHTTVEQLSHRFRSLIQQLFSTSSSSSTFDRQKQPVHELCILLPNEVEMLQGFHNWPTPPQITLCIHQTFVQEAIEQPNKVAIVLDDECLTYSELLTRAQQLALVLINEEGMQPGDIVVQCIDRSLEMVVGLLGIMMAGGVYAPVSPGDPFDRLASLVRQVRAKLTLTDRTSPSHVRLLPVAVVDVDERLNDAASVTDSQFDQLSRVPVTPNSISHLVFTSGSTGTPKAVQLRHRNFMSYLHSHFIQKKDIILQLANSSFDVHLDEILSALLRGGQLVLLKINGHLDLDYVTRVIDENNVTFVAPVPSWIDALSRYLAENQHAQHRVRKVRWWFLGGQCISLSQLDNIERSCFFLKVNSCLVQPFDSLFRLLASSVIS